MRRIVLALSLSLLSSAAFAQCNGQFASGSICGNSAAGQGLPSSATFTAILDRATGSTQGFMLNRGVSSWSGTATPSLGLNGTIGGSLTLQGATSGSSTIQVQAAAGTNTLFQLPNTNGTSTFVLSTDGSGHTSWVSNAAGGTVTSVALALPASTFTISGSPVTTTGTLTGSFANQTANTIFAGPTTGAATTPTWRALVGADLPNPSTSSLGGIQAINAVASNWIRSINGSGVPQLSQPAFSDISGSITPAQCPNPSASTIGCVESLVAVTSKWINTISTSGVPSATQPNFSDIAGNASLSQLPSISNNSVLANNSGGTAIPSSLTASNVLDMINNVQGDILYRNASNWVVLAPGTNGQVLTTAGAAANPTWTTVTGTGTVTSVATNNGLTGGPVTTTGTLGLATIATGNVLAYTSGGTGVPVATTPSAVLDVIGSATGDILYRAAGGTGWQVLAPGTNGQVLTQGASTPAWGNAGTVSNVTIANGTGITGTGTCNITTTGTCTIGISAARQTLPTTQSFTSGSGTYTTPANTLWIEVYMVGGGGGGGGSGSTSGTAATAGGDTCWNTTGAACTTPTSKAGGGVASTSQFNAGPGGATSGTCNILSQNGGSGQNGAGLNSVPGGTGGASILGGNGWGGNQGGTVGIASATNSGSGGGGGGSYVASTVAGGGGGAGSACEFIINSPAGTYTYAVGGAGTGQAAGTNGFAGGNGAAGRIWVIEHYGS